MLDDDETCEPGTDTPCPERCSASDPCSKGQLEGSASSCDARCTFTPITQPIAADGCCPPRANATTDSDCKAECGNGALESGERCDSDCPTSAADCNDNLPCTRDEISGTDCGRRCVHLEITGAESVSDGCCPAAADSTLDPDCEPRCSNRLTEAGEQCDDGNQIDADGCNAECQYDNNATTPGDDRPGYVACGAGSCGPDAHCCSVSGMPAACVGLTAQCAAPHSVCDGPEDCSANEECWNERYAFCAPSDQAHARGSQLCHIDPHCDSGRVCGGSGTCQASP
jgi:cysteine-rich repeat protein